ncbi:energy-coupling factor ABC transporter substrate-binding protein [Oceanirhabdus seepicola]|uniref:Cobalt transport protein CbiN n=1 Tax=Oceanirhabdus seepicola TaxID=2828781 RepID=A0A9J6P2A4_9CLOT|nr:energy-coupling factor ABC transporter substrate-binding protein [Oceanirhabdus seepicola]MCM1990029.1 energy-coupling factor ABC transporter substrate-binding protein [Oceanirhabdus seepicola]
MKSINKKLAIILLIIAMVIAPIMIKKGAEFGGADGEAEVAITEINPDYEPWFSSIWEPPSGEIESMLFSLQAAIGSGIIFYILGYLKGKNKNAANR